MALEGVERTRISGAGCTLSVLTTGNPSGPPLVLVHGMRDHAVSMLFARRHFPDCRLIMPDLRGHGDSDKPGTYGMLQYISDLRAVFDHFNLSSVWLLGHSLGGHIVTRFTSLYPASVSGLAVLDGMGPPRWPATDTSRLAMAERWRLTVDSQLTDPVRRLLPDMETAAQRLQRNNPGLSPEQVELLTQTGVEALEGGYLWKWDPRVDMMWTTFSTDENEQVWQDIDCPVLMVTGEHGLAYWTQRGMVPEGLSEGAVQTFYLQELERRRSLFKDAQHVELPGAGHMLHYDKPDQLGQILADFFQQKVQEPA